MAFIQLLYVFVFPPLAIARQFGLERRFYTNIFLTVLGFYPGLLHAVYNLTTDPHGLTPGGKRANEAM